MLKSLGSSSSPSSVVSSRIRQFRHLFSLRSLIPFFLGLFIGIFLCFFFFTSKNIEKLNLSKNVENSSWNSMKSRFLQPPNGLEGNSIENQEEEKQEGENLLRELDKKDEMIILNVEVPGEKVEEEKPAAVEEEKPAVAAVAAVVGPVDVSGHPHDIVAHYPIPDAPAGSCGSADYGKELMARWVGTRTPVCEAEEKNKSPFTAAKASDSSSSSSSSSLSPIIYEYYYKQIRHVGPDCFYTGHYWSFSLSGNEFSISCRPGGELIMGGQENGPVNGKLNPHKIIMNFLHSSRFGWNSPQSNTLIESQKAFYPLSHVLFVSRDCNGPPYNPFHCSCDLLNAYMQIHMFSIPTRDLTIIIWDSQPGGLFLPYWQALAGNGVYFRSEFQGNSEEIERLYKNSRPAGFLDGFSPSPSGGAPPPSYNGILAENAYFALDAGYSQLWKDGWISSPCSEISPILKGFSRFFSEIFVPRAQLAPFFLPPIPGKEISLNIVFSSRETAKYRRIADESQLFDHLCSQEILSLFPSVTFHCRRLNQGEFSFSEQISLYNSLDLLIGMHGAGLSLLLGIHSDRIEKTGPIGVLELFRAPEDRPRYYENIANHLGMNYQFLVNENPAANTELETRFSWETGIKPIWISMIEKRLEELQKKLLENI